MIQPWIAKELLNQKAAELERAAAPRWPGQASGRASLRGFVAVRTGRALVALGWRLGGSAALPATIRRRLA
jgi:hypothetical protein